MRKIEIQKVFIMTLILLFCSHNVKSADPFRVKRLVGKKIINMTDKSLKDWDSSFLVMKMDPKNSFTNQWTTINGRSPKPLIANDIDILVYMARDNNYWYIAIEAIDDKIIGVKSSSPCPYSGDCLEVFFAGKELNGKFDIHAYVENPVAPRTQASFFQFELSPTILDNKSSCFPDYRTDSTFKKDVIRFGFMNQTWRSDSGWYAEAKIPFAAFEKPVRTLIDGHNKLKLNIDYLDYDTELANCIAPNWGFDPDNVFCLSNEEKCVNVPRFMRSVIFE